MFNNEVIQKHSNIAFNHWKALWIKNCKENKGKIATSQKDFLNIYKDKTAYCFAYGPSFIKNVEEFKKRHDENHVVGCVDKAFRPLVEEGILPDYVLIADGSVSAEKWLKGVPGFAIRNALLISNVYGSPEWSDEWALQSGCKNIVWYLNKDNIKIDEKNTLGTAEYFGPIADYYEVIEAASNVGNSLIVFTKKIFGAKKIVLYGYDYCWTGSQYYGTGKINKFKWFPILKRLDMHNKMVSTTTNMEFSAQWLDTYIRIAKNDKVDIINSTGAGLLKDG